jgi:hypothetical protein
MMKSAGEQSAGQASVQGFSGQLGVGQEQVQMLHGRFSL